MSHLEKAEARQPIHVVHLQADLLAVAGSARRLQFVARSRLLLHHYPPLARSVSSASALVVWQAQMEDYLTVQVAPELAESVQEALVVMVQTEAG